jgi:hypothetical protein
VNGRPPRDRRRNRSRSVPQPLLPAAILAAGSSGSWGPPTRAVAVDGAPLAPGPARTSGRVGMTGRPGFLPESRESMIPVRCVATAATPRMLRS